MSRRRSAVIVTRRGEWIWWSLVRPVQAARQERVRRQVQRIKCRAARRVEADG